MVERDNEIKKCREENIKIQKEVDQQLEAETNANQELQVNDLYQNQIFMLTVHTQLMSSINQQKFNFL